MRSHRCRQTPHLSDRSLPLASVARRNSVVTNSCWRLSFGYISVVCDSHVQPSGPRLEMGGSLRATSGKYPMVNEGFTQSRFFEAWLTAVWILFNEFTDLATLTY